MATNWQELVPFYVNQTLSPAEKQAFEAQLMRDPALQREVAEWRTIGSAIWQGMNTPRNQVVPALPADFYTKLKTQPDTRSDIDIAQTVPSAPIVDFVVRRKVEEARRKTPFPVTMVAGFILTIFLGGFLILIATRPQPENPLDVASLTTPDSSETAPPTNQSPVPTATGIGLVEPPDTLTPLPPPIFTPSPVPTQVLSLPATLPPPVIGTPDPSTASLATITTPVPVVTWEGMVLQPDDCSVFNVTQTQSVLIHAQANRSSIVVGRLPVDMAWRTYSQSVEGWYQLVNPGQWIGWVAPEDVSLQGDCTDLWLPSPTPNITATIPVFSQPVPPQVYAVITSDSTEMRSQPNDTAQSQILMVTERNQEWLIQEYVEYTPENLWYLTTLPDGRDAWLFTGDIRIETRDNPTRTPIFNPTSTLIPVVTRTLLPTMTPQS
ncbi:MAG: anti-sigma factor family protein [Aggregatilineales bacterium]